MKAFYLAASGIAASFVAVLALQSTPTPEQIKEATNKEHGRIIQDCEKLDLRHSPSGEYDSHSGTRREGCVAATLKFRALHEANRAEGDRRWNMILASNEGANESRYWAERRANTLLSITTPHNPF